MFVKPTYMVHGNVFTLKATSPRNRKIVNAFFEEQGEKINELMDVDPDSIESLEQLSAIYDEYESYFKLFHLLTDGPHEKLDFEDFDVKVAEVAIRDFFPEATSIAMQRAGFLSF